MNGRGLSMDLTKEEKTFISELRELREIAPRDPFPGAIAETLHKRLEQERLDHVQKIGPNVYRMIPAVDA